jgi:hypothetical protein
LFRRKRRGKVLDEVSTAIPGGAAAWNAKDELTQKPPNTLNLLKIGSAFVVSSILLLCVSIWFFSV